MVLANGASSSTSPFPKDNDSVVEEDINAGELGFGDMPTSEEESAAVEEIYHVMNNHVMGVDASLTALNRYVNRRRR
jgi:hypothetical protein